jgi:hypothetical protein
LLLRSLGSRGAKRSGYWSVETSILWRVALVVKHTGSEIGFVTCVRETDKQNKLEEAG